MLHKLKEPIDNKSKAESELHERIVAYRDKIISCIAKKKIHELEMVLNELSLA